MSKNISKVLRPQLEQLPANPANPVREAAFSGFRYGVVFVAPRPGSTATEKAEVNQAIKYIRARQS